MSVDLLPKITSYLLPPFVIGLCRKRYKMNLLWLLQTVNKK